MSLDVSIFQAIYHKNLDKLKSLFESHEIDLDRKDDDGLSMLDLCIVYEFEEGAWLLIEKGITLLNRTQDNDYTIHLAVEYGMQGIVQKIIETHPECINFLDDNQQTPIRIAAVKIRTEPEQYLPIFETLIKNNADPYIKNKFGKNAIDAVATFCNEEKNAIEKLNEKYQFIK